MAGITVTDSRLLGLRWVMCKMILGSSVSFIGVYRVLLISDIAFFMCGCN